MYLSCAQFTLSFHLHFTIRSEFHKKNSVYLVINTVFARVISTIFFKPLEVEFKFSIQRFISALKDRVSSLIFQKSHPEMTFY